MEPENGQSMRRTEVYSSAVYKAVSIFFSFLCVIIISWAVVVNNNGTLSLPLRIILLLVGAAVPMGILYMLRSRKTLPTIIEKPVAGIGLLLVFVAIVGAGTLWPPAQSAMGSAYTYASQYVLTGQTAPLYVAVSPAQGPYYALLCFLFQIFRNFGATDFYFPLLVLQAAAVTVSVLLAYRATRSAFGPLRGLALLLGSITCLPLFIKAIVPLPQVLAMPLVTGVIFLWVRIRRMWRSDEYLMSLPYFCLLGGLGGVGALLWPGAWLFVLAVGLDMLVLLQGKGRLRVLLAGFLVAVLLYVGAGFAVHFSSSMPPDASSDPGIPLSHWVTAGIADNGQNYETELDAMLQRDSKTLRADYASIEYKLKTEGWGVQQYLRHAVNKVIYLFGEQSSNVNQPVLAMVEKYVAYAASMGLILLLVFGAVQAAFKGNEFFSFWRLAMCLLLFGLLLFPAKPVDLLPVLPVVLFAAMEAVPIAQSAQQKNARQNLMREVAQEWQKQAADAPGQKNGARVWKKAIGVPREDTEDMDGLEELEELDIPLPPITPQEKAAVQVPARGADAKNRQVFTRQQKPDARIAQQAAQQPKQTMQAAGRQQVRQTPPKANKAESPTTPPPQATRPFAQTNGYGSSPYAPVQQPRYTENAPHAPAPEINYGTDYTGRSAQRESIPQEEAPWWENNELVPKE
ncbi:MAG: hypothetical protein ACK5JF_11460 [Oscillospiraceae bacterium]